MYAQEKLVAVAAVTAAARLCEEIRAQKNALVLNKADQSPVTVADFSSQALICQALSTAFPQDSIIGEENGDMLKQPGMETCLQNVTRYVRRLIPNTQETDVIHWINQGNGEWAERYWTLDPIDGTKGYIRGDQYAIALALVEKGEVKVGVMGCPALPKRCTDESGEKGMLFSAVHNQGAEMIPLGGGNSQEIRVNQINNPQQLQAIESVVSSHSDRSLQRQLAQRLGLTKKVMQMDSLAKYGVVARGEADLYVRIPLRSKWSRKENVWDHAVGAIMVTEAGGKVSDLEGKPLDFSCGAKLSNNLGIVVTNGLIHDPVIELCGELIVNS